MEDLPNVDIVVVPVGGGGLISGISAAIKLSNPGVRIIGVEPEGSNSMYLSLKQGSPASIVVGIIIFKIIISFYSQNLL